MNSEKIQEIREKTVAVLKSYFSEEAADILREIEAVKGDPEIRNDLKALQELEIYSSLLKFILFPTLPEEEQLFLFRNHLVKAFRVGLDIKNRFSIKMSLTPDALWPETVQFFVEAMLKNEEKIGRGEIAISGENSRVAPTLGNWLRDYNRIYGMDRHEKIIPLRHTSENVNVQNLDKEEKVLLLRILEFYEELKFPSQKQIQEALSKVIDQYIESGKEIPLEELVEDNEEELLSEVKEEMGLLEEQEKWDDDELNNLIKKYPRVLKQTIGKEPIKLLFNGEMVEPRIENWLADYRAYAGAGPHEVNERSDYLLRSPNVKNLSTEEREQLGFLLRSYDEGYLLPFSLKKQEIAFNRIKR